MRTIKLLLEYDCTSYPGWQSQRSGSAIQDIISRTIGSITGERIRLIAASRTDAGVHALGQVAAFITGSDLSSEVLKRALNANLPPDIRVLSADEARPTFHPRYDATKKRYFYLIRLSSDGSAFFSRYTWHVRTALDTDAMHKAVEYVHFGQSYASKTLAASVGSRFQIPCAVINVDQTASVNVFVLSDFKVEGFALTGPSLTIRS